MLDSLLRYSILILLIILYLVLFYAVPKYFQKKGENLATKQDIEKITTLTEEVKSEFQKQINIFSKDLDFKYEYYFKQFSELYSHLYAIIAQSEYIRQFLFLCDGKERDFEQIPFLDSKWKKIYSKPNSDNTVSIIEEEITNEITKFCKEELCSLIIKKKEFATQSLLKLAVAYRYANEHYTEKNPDSPNTRIADKEEVQLIKTIVITVVKEYNFLRKELQLDYIENELNTGHFQNINEI